MAPKTNFAFERDKSRARNAANSGHSATIGEISVRARLCGGAGSTRTDIDCIGHFPKCDNSRGVKLKRESLATVAPRRNLRRYPHLQREVTRHGKIVWYVRSERHDARIRLRAAFGTPEFCEEYKAALTGSPAVRPSAGRRTAQYRGLERRIAEKHSQLSALIATYESDGSCDVEDSYLPEHFAGRI